MYDFIKYDISEYSTYELNIFYLYKRESEVVFSKMF